MSNISFENSSNIKMQNLSPEMQNRLQSEENFGAIDKEKLKQDTVELTTKASEQVKDNFIFRALKNIGVEDPKKTLKSIAYTALTVITVATLGNKFSNKFADLGLKVDDLTKNSKFLGSISDKLSNCKKAISNFFKSRKGVIGDLANTLSNPAKKVAPEQGFAISYCSGPKYQFASAVIESMQGIFYGDSKKLAKKLMENDNFKNIFQNSNKLDKEIIRKILSNELDEKALRAQYANIPDDIINKLFSETKAIRKSRLDMMTQMVGKANAEDAFNRIVIDSEANRVAFVDEFISNIRKNIGNNGKEATNKELLNFFKKIQSGDGNFKSCKDVNMIHGMDNWCTTNWIDKLGSKIFKDKWKNVSKANVGSTLIKYSATSGQLADSAMGKFVQGFPTIFSESVSNYVCDMAFINAMVLPSFIDLYNNVQDAPKEQKGATLANEFMSGVGNLTLVTPAAGAIMYGGLASLRNLEGKTIPSKILKMAGEVFGLGLTKAGKPKPKFLTRFVGGGFRLFMIMFVLNSLISKPITKLTQKIFGKPYDKDEAIKAQELEAQKQQVIPELGITQGELMEKIQKNPSALEKLQSDPKLAQTIQQNPKALLDLLDNKEVQYIEPKPTPASQGKILSPANKNRLNNSTQMATSSIDKTKTTAKTTPIENNNQNVDSATYIPSSAFVAPQSSLSQEQLNEYNNMMTRADKVLKEAEKYI